jgi:biopolymer transport protein ExbD
MKVRNAGAREEKIELQMTPMIDIVFQLLIFFIMTFKIVVPEGDFNIKMPLSAPSQGPPDENLTPPIKVRLTTSGGGSVGIRMNDTPIGDFTQLRGRVVGLIGDERGPGSIADSAEVEFDCDYDLDYKHVIQAISAVSGYISPDKKVIKLIEKIKFAPPRPPR